MLFALSSVLLCCWVVFDVFSRMSLSGCQVWARFPRFRISYAVFVVSVLVCLWECCDFMFRVLEICRRLKFTQYRAGVWKWSLPTDPSPSRPPVPALEQKPVSQFGVFRI